MTQLQEQPYRMYFSNLPAFSQNIWEEIFNSNRFLRTLSLFFLFIWPFATSSLACIYNENWKFVFNIFIHNFYSMLDDGKFCDGIAFVEKLDMVPLIVILNIGLHRLYPTPI